MNQMILTILGAVLCENFVFSQMFGLDTIAREEKSLKIIALDATVTSLILAIAAVLSFGISTLLDPIGMDYLVTLILAMVLMCAQWGWNRVLHRETSFPGSFLNSAVFAVIYTMSDCRSFGESLQVGIISALGFFMASMLICGIRARLETSDIPESFRGLPILALAAGLCAMIFTGFSGLSF